MKNQNCYLLSVDAKDLYLSQLSGAAESGGYPVRNADGSLRAHKFLSTLDYSLEAEKLHEVYRTVYPEEPFSVLQEQKAYTQSVVSVTFQFSVKKFNRWKGSVMVRHDIPGEEVRLEDCVYLREGALAAVRLEEQVGHPLDAELLEPYFYFDPEARVYRVRPYLPTVKTVADLRRKLYEDGFVCDGRKYIRYKRSAGSSRLGKCLFIDENLYPLIHKWELCGLDLREGEQVDLAALESYLSLPLSSIVGTVRIRPENILVIEDVYSEFQDTVTAVAQEDGHLCAEERLTPVRNNIFDGQSLIDPSVLGEYRPRGFVLLRNRMFKSACFNCNVQDWFRDHGITSVSQVRGHTRAKKLEDIRLITTPSSIKYLKFGTLEEWLDNLEPTFGVVKHDKPTHFFGGKLVQLHYQLINTLQLSQGEVDRLMEPSFEYLRLLKTEPAAFRFHTGAHAAGTGLEEPVFAKNDIVYQLLGRSEKFTATRLYRDFRTESLKAFTQNLRCGHVLVNGNYSTLCGNPIEMLECACGLFRGDSQLGAGNLYSKRFPFGTEILGSRSPHITMGNIWVAQNRDNEEISRYLNLTENIVCVNSIGENLLARLSGCDFDSDSVLLTDEPVLLRAAKKNYKSFTVPTSCVPAKKITRRYSGGEKADLDIRTSVNRIGEIVNLSQELNTLFWDKVNSGSVIAALSELYRDISILDVLSNIEIDKAKREYALDSGGEIERIKRKYQLTDSSGKSVKPNFFGFLARKKGYYDGDKKKYSFHRTSMDYLQHAVNRFRSPLQRQEFLRFSEILNAEGYSCKKVNYKQVNSLLERVRGAKAEIQAIWKSDNPELDRERKYRLTQEIHEKTARLIGSLSMNPSTMYRLLLAIEEEKNRDIAKTLFYSLFSTANGCFYQLVTASQTPVSTLREDPEGEYRLFGIRFAKSAE